MRFSRLSLLLCVVSETAVAQPRLPSDPRLPAGHLPGGAHLPTAPTLNPPQVHFAPGSSTTTATEATFSTSLTGTSFEWDFGGAAVPRTLTTTGPTTPAVVLAHDGAYAVRVTSRSGATSAAATASVVVSPFRATVSGIDTGVSRSLSRGATDRYTMFAGAGGELSLVQCATVGASKFTRVVRRHLGTWTPFDVTARSIPTVGTTGAWSCGTPVAAMGSDGRLRIVAHRSASRLALFVAHTTTPTGVADWTESVIADDATPDFEVSLSIRTDGRPMVSYSTEAGGRVMKVAVANTASPSGPSDWTKVVPTTMIGVPTLATNRDAPAVIFPNAFGPPAPDGNVHLAYATTASPRVAGDFRVVTLPRTGGLLDGAQAALTMYDGKLIAIYHEAGGMKLVRANVDSPMAATDFTSTFIDEHAAPFSGGALPTTVQLFQGRLMVSYSAAYGERVAIARTHVPAGPADWEVFTINPLTFANFAMAPTVNGGRSSITTAYWVADAPADSTLTGVLSDEWR